MKLKLNIRKIIEFSGKTLIFLWAIVGLVLMIFAIYEEVKTIIPEKYSYRESYNTNQEDDIVYLYNKLNDKYAIRYDNCGGESKLYDLKNKTIIHKDEIYDIINTDDVYDSLLVYINKQYKKGFVNAYTGKIQVKAQYDHAWVFGEGVAAVVKEGKLGFIDKNNNIIIPFKYHYLDEIWPYTYRFYNGLCKVTDERGLCGLIDHEGKWVIKPIYEKIKRPIEYGYRKVKKNGKWGLLDENLKLILPIMYDYINFESKNSILVSNNGRSYYIDLKQNKLTQPELSCVNLDFFYAKRYIITCVYKEKDCDGIYSMGEYFYGVFDLLKQKEILPPIYEIVQVKESGHYITDVEGANYYELQFEAVRNSTVYLYDYKGALIK